MNRDLISKLYQQAVEHCVQQGPNADGTNRAWVWEEKFAELIVTTCTDQIHALREPHGNEQVEYALFIAEKRIRDRFGIQ